MSGDDGMTIIDPGPRTSSSEQEWLAAMERLGFEFSDIASIVLTHHHPDHYGLAGWFQERSGAKVWMSERAHREAMLMWERIPRWITNSRRSSGAWHAGNQACPVAGASERLLPQVTPRPEISFISEDLPFRMGDRIWVPVQTAGHAPGHLSFFHADSGVLLCGDAVRRKSRPT